MKPPTVEAMRRGQPLKRGQSQCPKVYKKNIKQPLRRGQPLKRGQSQCPNVYKTNIKQPLRRGQPPGEKAKATIPKRPLLEVVFVYQYTLMLYCMLHIYTVHLTHTSVIQYVLKVH